MRLSCFLNAERNFLASLKAAENGNCWILTTILEMHENVPMGALGVGFHEVCCFARASVHSVGGSN